MFSASLSAQLTLPRPASCVCNAASASLSASAVLSDINSSKRLRRSCAGPVFCWQRGQTRFPSLPIGPSLGKTCAPSKCVAYSCAATQSAFQTSEPTSPNGSFPEMSARAASCAACAASFAVHEFFRADACPASNAPSINVMRALNERAAVAFPRRSAIRVGCAPSASFRRANSALSSSENAQSFFVYRLVGCRSFEIAKESTRYGYALALFERCSLCKEQPFNFSHKRIEPCLDRLNDLIQSKWNVEISRQKAQLISFIDVQLSRPRIEDAKSGQLNHPCQFRLSKRSWLLPQRH